jgi:uncharacterized Zn finger protein
MANVRGSSYEPYRVTVVLDEGGIVSATCTCPYDWGGYCKHIVATLLTAIRNPSEVKERPTLDALLADLDADTLRRLLGAMLAHRPDLIAWLEGQLALGKPTALGPSDAGQPAQRAPVNANAIRRLVRGVMRTSGDYYATSGVVSGLNDVLQQARQAVEAGDGESALAVAEIIADETIPGWEEHDDSDGEFGGWFDELGAVFTEALLTADLTQAEREAWARKLEAWHAELEDCGVEEAFPAAIEAARQGWDAELLRRKLAGRFRRPDPSEIEEPWYADALTGARLNVLERQGRIEEYLHLAQAEGEAERYATMLVKAGRMQEAVDYGLHNLIAPEEALALAAELRRRGELRAALQIGEHGLGLSGSQLGALARWVRDVAAAAGEGALALRAAVAAFKADAALADYQAVQPLAGDAWPAIQAELLSHLAALEFAFARTEIYLSEGMVDAAIRAVDAQRYVGHAEIMRIAEVAWQSHPDWVIRQCRQQAEPIMDEGKSKYYASAILWLELARRAYGAAGRSDEWRSYCEGLIA